MKSKYLQGLVVLAALFFFGCASGKVVSQPSQITLEEAMGSVGRGLRNMRQEQQDLRTALIPSEISVTFNIAASGTDNRKLYVDVSSYPVGGGAGKFGTEVSSTLNSQRGNQITIKFTSLLLADNKTLVFNKKPEEALYLYKLLEKEGITKAEAAK